MDSKSLSSGLSSGSSILSSQSSQAASAASKASASLASGSAKATSYVKGATPDTSTSAGIFALSPLTLSILAVALGAAYYNGYLDGLIAYLQNMLNQAQNQKERTLKDSTGHTSIQTAAQEQYDAATVKTENAVNQLHADAQERAGGVKANQSEGLLSAATH